MLEAAFTHYISWTNSDESGAQKDAAIHVHIFDIKKENSKHILIN